MFFIIKSYGYNIKNHSGTVFAIEGTDKQKPLHRRKYNETEKE